MLNKFKNDICNGNSAKRQYQLYSICDTSNRNDDFFSLLLKEIHYTLQKGVVLVIMTSIMRNSNNKGMNNKDSIEFTG
jgi:hypothetical protein